MEPYEIIAAPLTVWQAPVGEAFPEIDAAPAGNWEKIGTLGDQEYAEEGVTVAHPQTIETYRGLGNTGPIKAFRTEEDFMIRFVLNDLTLEQYALVLNGNTVTTTAAGAGTAGFKELPSYRGLTVARYALLARGIWSPYGAGWNAQYEVPVCYQSASPEPVYQKGTPAGLAFEFTALIDTNAASEAERFGRIKIQDADPA